MFISKIRKACTFLLGDFSWRPPGWLQRGTGALWARVRAHRLATALIVLAALMLVGGGWYGWHWSASQPKPATLHVTVVNPGVTPFADKLVPMPLLINFNG